jgi:putative ABC transport system permease protein
METFFGISTTWLAAGAMAMLVVVGIVLGAVARRRPVLRGLALRQLPRRPAQTALIVLGLMISTTLVTASLATGDTLTFSLRSAAVNEIGRLDVVVTFSNVARLATQAVGTGDPFAQVAPFPLATFDRLRAAVPTDPVLARDVVGITPAIWLTCRAVDLTSKQGAGAAIRGIPADYDRAFGELVARDGSPIDLARLEPGDAVLNASGALTLAASVGDEVTCTGSSVSLRLRIAAIAAASGLGTGSTVALTVPLSHLSESLSSRASATLSPEGPNPAPTANGRIGADDNRAVAEVAGEGRTVGPLINQIWVTVRGTAISSAERAPAVATALRATLVDDEADRALKAFLQEPEFRVALANRRPNLQLRVQRALDELDVLVTGRPPTVTDAPGAGEFALTVPASASEARERLDRVLRVGGVRGALVQAARDLPDSSKGPQLEQVLQQATGFLVLPIKETVLVAADRAGNVLSTIFLLFSLLSIAAGLLLVFLIFSLLVASRRTELGIARALGASATDLVAMVTLEGAAYAALASVAGVPAGLAVSRGLLATLVWAVESGYAGFTGAGARVAEVARWSAEPRSIVLAGAIGLLLTVATVAIAAWRVTRVTIVTAIRDLPDPPKRRRAASDAHSVAGRHGLDPHTLITSRVRVGRILSLWVLTLERRATAAIALVGVVVSVWAAWAVRGTWFSIGLSVIAVAVGMAVRDAVAKRDGVEYDEARRLGVSTGAALWGVLWLLPFDWQVALGMKQFDGGIEYFAVGGLSAVAAAMVVAALNGDLVQRGVAALLSRLRMSAPALRLALAHVSRYPYRTGMTATMFAVVIFMLTIMQVLTASISDSQGDRQTAYGGFEIQGQISNQLVTFGQVQADDLALSVAGSVGGTARAVPPDPTSTPGAASSNPASVASGEGSAGTSARDALLAREPSQLAVEALENTSLRPYLSGAGTRVTSAVALLQLSAARPAWGGYAVAGIDEGFANASSIALENRTAAYASDRDAWLAVARDPSLAIVDSGVLPKPEMRGGNAGLGMIGFTLEGLPSAPGTMAAQRIWVANPLTPNGQVGAKPVTVVGVIDRRTSPNFRGVHVSIETARSLGQPFRPPLARYYFRLREGVAIGDARAAIGEAFFADGLQTTDLDETWRNQTGPVLLGSGLLQLFVGLGLISGIAALAVVATRSTLERRQQIGMLRAVGATRAHVASSLLLEGTVVVALGGVAGTSIGLWLCRNVFAVQFFDRFRPGSVLMVVPWEQLAATLALTCVIALVATFVPAWRGASVPPVAAIRAD